MRPLRTILVFVGLAASACGASIREAQALQPFPAASATAASVSLPLYIHQRDVHLPRDYQLRSSAQFVVLNHDRLRVHALISGWIDDEAQTSGWRAWLEDETGRRYAPAGREGARVERVEVHWALAPFQSSDPTCTNHVCKSRLVNGFEAFDGQADYLFEVPGLFTAERRRLAFVLERGGVQYRYTWRFGEGQAVHNYGRTKVDDELGTIVIPGPDTEVAGIKHEGEKW